MTETKMTAGDAAKICGLTPQAIRQAAEAGRLRIAERTVGGVRLFDRSEVERFQLARESRVQRKQ